MADPRESLRLFIAVRCPASPALREVLAALERLRPAVKPVAAADLHLTLRFLGDTPAAHLPALSAALDQALMPGAQKEAAEAARIIVQAHPAPTRKAAPPAAFEVQWAHLGRFPANVRQPARVIYVEPEDPGPFHQLVSAIDATLAKLELVPPLAPPARRPFTPHLTLARAKTTDRGRRAGRAGRSASPAPSDPIEALCQRYAGRALGASRIEAVQLIASRLTPHGPVHTVHHEVPLA